MMGFVFCMVYYSFVVPIGTSSVVIVGSIVPSVVPDFDRSNGFLGSGMWYGFNRNTITVRNSTKEGQN